LLFWRSVASENKGIAYGKRAFHDSRKVESGNKSGVIEPNASDLPVPVTMGVGREPDQRNRAAKGLTSINREKTSASHERDAWRLIDRGIEIVSL
jgi:hypothetical protein